MGNISIDPLFANAGANDLNLLSGSDCIDSGSNAAIPAGVTTDLAGNPRISNVTVDMGALEFQDDDGDRVPDGCDTPTVHNLIQATDHFTIQEAIFFAVNGDIIEAEPGIYHEAINFSGRAIVIRSASGNPPDTLIDGTGNFHVVQRVSGEGFGSVLSGFTVTGGNANGASPDERGCGMYCDGASPIIFDCVFSNNTAQFGAGLYNINGTSSSIVNCIFENNAATSVGGAIVNVANYSPTIVQCTFNKDTAGVDGGGLATSNLEGDATISNSILWGNSDSGGMDESAQIFVGPGAFTPAVSYSNVMSGWSGIGAGNINIDPLFADADGSDDTFGTTDDNPRLQAGSPCIDAGDTTAIPAGIFSDLDGNPRAVDDPVKTNTGITVSIAAVDIGAYEFIPGARSLQIVGDLNCDGIVNELDFALMALHWLKRIKEKYSAFSQKKEKDWSYRLMVYTM